MARRRPKETAITPCYVIEALGLPGKLHGFNLQLSDSSGNPPGNQPRKHWKQSLASIASRDDNSLPCEARRHEHNARRQPRSVLLTGVFVFLASTAGEGGADSQVRDRSLGVAVAPGCLRHGSGSVYPSACLGLYRSIQVYIYEGLYRPDAGALPRREESAGFPPNGAAAAHAGTRSSKLKCAPAPSQIWYRPKNSENTRSALLIKLYGNQGSGAQPRLHGAASHPPLTPAVTREVPCSRGALQVAAPLFLTLRSHV